MYKLSMTYYYTAKDPATNKPLATGIVVTKDEQAAKREITNALPKTSAYRKGHRNFDVEFSGNKGLFAAHAFTYRGVA